MKEAGIDIAARRPIALTSEMLEHADRVVTMGCGVEDACPATFVETDDWGLEDPKGQPLEKVRQIRDEIEKRVTTLLDELQ